jgi:hypothetical protein
MQIESCPSSPTHPERRKRKHSRPKKKVYNTLPLNITHTHTKDTHTKTIHTLKDTYTHTHIHTLKDTDTDTDTHTNTHTQHFFCFFFLLGGTENFFFKASGGIGRKRKKFRKIGKKGRRKE